MKSRIRTVKGGGRKWEMRVHPKSHLGKCIQRGQGRAYEHDMLDYIRDQHSPNDLAIDVGAHIGNHTLYMAIACGFRVVAFEPVFYRHLDENVKINHLEDRVQIVPCGLSDGSRYMRDTGERVLSNPLGPVEQSEAKLINGTSSDAVDKVSVHALDDLDIEEQWGSISLIKADIEGMEPLMLNGALHTLKRCEPALYLETKTDEDIAVVEKIIGPLGYERTATFKKLTQRTAWVVPS